MVTFRSGRGPGDGSSNELPRWQARLFLSIFTLGGLCFALLGAWNVSEMSRQLAGARETTGTVHSAEIRTETSTDSESGRTTTHYVPRVEYRYEVDGKIYASDRLYPGGFFIRGPGDENSAMARRRVGEFPSGARVRVWYLPDEPRTSFLKPVRRLENGMFTLVGAIIAASGAGLLLPLVVSVPASRFACATVLFLLAQTLTWLLWHAFVDAPSEQLSGSPRLLLWLLVAYVLVCWSAMIAHAPLQLAKLREATLVSLLIGTVVMSLSLFVLVPLSLVAPALEPVRALPWVGVVTAALALVLWMFGCVTVGGASRPPSPDGPMVPPTR